MSENLFRTVGKSQADNLIADISFPLQTGSAVIRAEAGFLLRGTVLGKGVDGKYEKASAVIEGDCILADNVLVGEADMTVVTYVSGAFAQSSLICENDIDEQRDALRTKGIYIKATVGGGRV